jgi:ABC-type transport system substrate-binding protein
MPDKSDPNHSQYMRRKYFIAFYSLLFLLCLGGCDKPLNSVHTEKEIASNTLFTPFSGRSPKHLDPTSSYSSDETPYTYSIYEPLYQYNYLERPYRLEPRAAERVVAPSYFDKDGRALPQDAAPSDIALSVYEIPIKKGILFAPHPAFARDAKGNPLYWNLSASEIEKLSGPLDLKEKGTRELTAEDYVYSIKRLASPRQISPVYSTMTAYVPGLKELAEELREEDRKVRGTLPLGERDLPFLDLRRFPLKGVSAPDAHTLRIEIKGKYPQFPNWLAMTFFSPVPWEAERFYSQKGMAKKNLSLNYWPVGTGPYYLAESIENRRHVMVRNPLFRKTELYPCRGEEKDKERGFLEDCGRPVPFIDRVEITAEKESVPLSAKFLQGYYDSPQIERLDNGQGFLIGMADSPKKEKEYREKKLQFPQTVEASNTYFGFNWLDPVVGRGDTPEQQEKNRKLRLAVSIAFDWEEFVQIFEKGMAQVAYGPLPPGIFGYDDAGAAGFNPYLYDRLPDGSVRKKTLAEAKKLLAEAGYPDGRDEKTGKPLVLNLDYQSAATPGARGVLAWYQKQFDKLGIQLNIRATDYNRFQDKVIGGSHQLFLWGWLADYPDAENFLFLLAGPNAKSKTGGAGENAANYQNAEYDAHFEKMRYLEDGEEKKKEIEALIRIAQRDAPWMFGYFPTSAAAFHQWVKNGKPTQMVRNHIQYMRLDPAVRAEKTAEWNRPVLWPLAVVLALVLAVIGGLVRVKRRKDAALGIKEEK